jgi:hypothetical protein
VSSANNDSGFGSDIASPTHHCTVRVEDKELDVIRRPCSDLVILQPAPRQGAKVSIDQAAKTLLPRLAKSLSKPSISRASVFGQAAHEPCMPTPWIRIVPRISCVKTPDGNRTLGR